MQEGCDSRKNSNPVVGTRTMYKDMEDFLFKMLGEEFRLERDAIQVLNRCGYDMQKVVDAFVKGDQDQANKILEQSLGLYPTKGIKWRTH
ncbi:hypothetical protein V6Z11_D08G021100 [Gossypium hirsutum]